MMYVDLITKHENEDYMFETFFNLVTSTFDGLNISWITKPNLGV
jgi:hypothetical protein